MPNYPPEIQPFVDRLAKAPGVRGITLRKQRICPHSGNAQYYITWSVANLDIETRYEPSRPMSDYFPSDSNPLADINADANAEHAADLAEQIADERAEHAEELFRGYPDEGREEEEESK